MEATADYLERTHDNAYATCTATLGSFPAIVGGEYPDGAGLHEKSSVVNHFSEFSIGITTNHPLSEQYGEGFDSFTSPRGGEGVKERAAARLSRGTLTYRIASWGWSKFQKLASAFGSVDKSFRPTEDVIDQFLNETTDEDEWFGWLHFMEPHHPYNPDSADIGRAEAQRVTRKILPGKVTEDEEELVRDLYRREVEELDRLWDAPPTRALSSAPTTESCSVRTASGDTPA